MAIVDVETLAAEQAAREKDCCRVLEEGHVLFFRKTPLDVPADDREFLLAQRQTGAVYHKNIAYRPGSDRVSGVAGAGREDLERLKGVLRRFSCAAVDFTAGLLPRYASRWTVDYASFRPQEEAGRALSRHSRNDLLHVDSFPTRPTSGDRIFRVFANINPAAPRVWRTGETFEELAQRFAVSSGLLDGVLRRGFGKKVVAAAASMGLPVTARPAYDEFMHRFHNFLKDSDDYQANARAEQLSFPAGSSWMVFTDMVSHSVLSGQYALEQTFLISRESLWLPQKAPIAILEKIAGRAMA
jgi:3-deoxy-D-manno-octulosonic acid hydroxylase-like protein